MLPPDWAETNVYISGGQKVHGPSRVCLYEAYLNAIFSLRLRQVSDKVIKNIPARKSTENPVFDSIDYFSTI